MKLSRSKAMREMLRRGLEIAEKTPCPSDGYMANLIYETKPNGWHYQVEYVHDSRFVPPRHVTVYAFAPPRRFCARSAYFSLMSEVK